MYKMKVFFWLPVAVTLILSLRGIGASASDKDAQVQKAIQMCRDKLAKDPDFPKALHMLGVLLETSSPSVDDPSHDSSRRQQLEEIATSFWKAGIGEENSLEDSTRIDSLVRGASHFLKLGDNSRASACYRKALDFTIQLKDESGVLESILQAATPTLLSSLQSPLYNETLQLVQRLLERFPTHPLVHQLHGAVLRKNRRLAEAHQAYHTATSLLQQQLGSGSDPIQWIQSCILAAASAREAGLPEAAQMEYLKPAAQILSTNKDIPSDVQSDLYNNMGIVLKKAGKTNEAITHFQRAISANPGDGHALAQLASLNVDVSSTTTFDPDYVQGLFDGYAARFEDELVQNLNYKGHQMVVDALKSWWEKNDASCLSRPLALIDVGCGTGLVGEEIKKIHPNIHLQGFDLSQRMVELASARSLQDGRVYSIVRQGDAAELLAQEPAETVDAIVAADVFIYIGDISSILEASYNCLKEGGVIVFSLETIADGMRLLPSGRFGHSREYVKERARLFGLELVQWSDGVLRKQGGKDVQGATVTLQKPSPSLNAN
jgi:predicted TPR repeat methyltransferase